MQKRPRKLLDQACTELRRSIHDALRRKHYSICTERAYLSWIKHYILSHNKRHPSKMGSPEMEALLTHLTVEQHVGLVLA